MRPDPRYEHPSSNLFLLRLLVQANGKGSEETYIKVQHVLGREACYVSAAGYPLLVDALLSLMSGCGGTVMVAEDKQELTK